MSDENKEPMVDHKNGTTQLSDQELDAVVGGDDNSTFLYFVSDALRIDVGHVKDRHCECARISVFTLTAFFKLCGLHGQRA